MLSSTKQQHQEFWKKFKEYVGRHDSALNLTRKHYPTHYYRIGIKGVRTGVARITLTRNTREKEITCQIIIINRQDLLNRIYNDRDKIKSELGYLPEYEFLEEKNQSKVIVRKGIDPTYEKNWNGCFQWLMERTKEFKTVFPNYFKLA